MNGRPGRGGDETAVWLPRECRDAAIDFGIGAHVDRDELHTRRDRRPLDRRELANTAGHSWIANDRHACDARRYVLEQLKPFRAQGELECGKSSDVAAGLRQTRDEATADGIAHVYEYNRDGARCLLQWTHGRIAVRHNHVRRQRDELRRMFLQQADITGMTMTSPWSQTRCSLPRRFHT